MKEQVVCRNQDELTNRTWSFSDRSQRQQSVYPVDRGLPVVYAVDNLGDDGGGDDELRSGNEVFGGRLGQFHIKIRSRGLERDARLESFGRRKLKLQG
ncbi:hypothetical protein ACLB2K_022218 [Fragaria x ananassa]